MSLAAAILSWNARMSDVQLKRPLCGAMMPVRVVHVVAGIGVTDGGVSYSVPRLCRALAEAGVRPTLLSVSANIGSRAETRSRGYGQRAFVWDYPTIPVLRELRASSALSS